MPIYHYECECGATADEYRKIAERGRGPICGTCRCEMPRGIERPNINPDWEPYQDPNLVPMHTAGGGVWVKGRQHRKEIMRERGIVEVG